MFHYSNRCNAVVEFDVVAAPSLEAQATDALLAVAKMQPLATDGAKLATEQEIQDLKHQASCRESICLETEVCCFMSYIFSHFTSKLYLVGVILNFVQFCKNIVECSIVNFCLYSHKVRSYKHVFSCHCSENIAGIFSILQ